MNKYLIKLRRALARMSHPAESEKCFFPDSRTTRAIESWVKDKGYCLPDVGIDEVAARLGISRDQLTAYSANVLNKNFLTWRKELRMEEAKRLLFVDPDRNLTRLAESLGVDRSNFRRQFEEVTGMSIAQWCDKVRG